MSDTPAAPQTGSPDAAGDHRHQLGDSRKEGRSDLFVHTPGREHPEILEVEETDVIRTLLVEDDGNGHVWMEGTEEEIDVDLTFAAVGIRHHHHVHRGRCHQVDVIVRWNGDHDHRFAPAITIATVEEWAFDKVAHFSPEQAAQHVLAEPGADHFLEGSVHVGSLVKPGSCAVTLDLLPRSRFEG